MTACLDSAMLRAYLDHELPEETAASVTNHVATCVSCEIRLSAIREIANETHGHLAALDMKPSGIGKARTLEHLRVRVEQEAAVRTDVVVLRKRRLARTRRIPALLAAAAALLLIVLVPQTRALAGQLLGVFRAQSVVYVQVPQSRVQQLETLQGQANALFLAKPQPVGTAPSVQTVETIEQASKDAGFTLQTPAALPSGLQSAEIQVQGQGTYSMKVNVKTVRQVLQALGVTDVTIPDALGAQPITIAMPPVAQTRYQGTAMTLTLIQGTSPIVTLPPGVSLPQLGRAALEVYGMPSDQARQLSQQIDWNSTLVFPFPQGVTSMQQVSVHGAQGIMVQSPNTSGSNSHLQTMLYWQQGARFYILIGQGIANAAMLTAADSVQ